MEELYQEWKLLEPGEPRGMFWHRVVEATSEEFDCQLDHYIVCRQNGTSPALAEIFATGQSPQLKGTDAQLWAGWGTQNQFGDGNMANDVQEKYRGPAEKAGVNTVGRRYLSSLASFPGDPTAWVADSHDIGRVCREKGWSCEGAVNVKAAGKDEILHRQKIGTLPPPETKE